MAAVPEYILLTGAGMRRCRVSVWAGAQSINLQSMSKGKNIIDDVSILKTILNDNKMEAVLDPQACPGFTGKPDKQKEFFQNIVRVCHTNNIQCFAGFDLANISDNDPAVIEMNRWLKSKPNSGQIERFARSCVDRLNNLFGDGDRIPFDGISFDIEAIHGGKDVAERQSWGVTLTSFYQKVAELIKSGPDSSNRVVAVAGGPLVDATHRNFIPGTKRFSGNDQIANTPTLAHPYEMVRNIPNMIMRPMCYDNFQVGTPEPIVFQWHQDVIDYAVSKGITPDNFQLGVKVWPGDKNKGPKGYDGLVTDPKDVEKRCKKILRHRGIGLILFGFPTPTASWDNIARYNFALNGIVDAKGDADFSKFDAKKPFFYTVLPGLSTVPTQAPLGADGVRLLRK